MVVGVAGGQHERAANLGLLFHAHFKRTQGALFFFPGRSEGLGILDMVFYNLVFNTNAYSLLGVKLGMEWEHGRVVTYIWDKG